MGLAFADSADFPGLILEQDEWLLEFDESPTEHQSSAFRSYLNDYRLRDLMDSKTDQLREKIVTKALLNVYGKE